VAEALDTSEVLAASFANTTSSRSKPHSFSSLRDSREIRLTAKFVPNPCRLAWFTLDCHCFVFLREQRIWTCDSTGTNQTNTLLRVPILIVSATIKTIYSYYTSIPENILLNRRENLATVQVRTVAFSLRVLRRQGPLHVIRCCRTLTVNRTFSS
jgi:hypothetical protein